MFFYSATEILRSKSFKDTLPAEWAIQCIINIDHKWATLATYLPNFRSPGQSPVLRSYATEEVFVELIQPKVTFRFTQYSCCNICFCDNYTRPQEQTVYKIEILPKMALQLLTQLLQEVINQVEEAGDGVFGFSGIDLGFLSSLWSLYREKDRWTTVPMVCLHLLEMKNQPLISQQVQFSDAFFLTHETIISHCRVFFFFWSYLHGEMLLFLIHMTVMSRQSACLHWVYLYFKKTNIISFPHFLTQEYTVYS